MLSWKCTKALYKTIVQSNEAAVFILMDGSQGC
jgi:hypothetical protein